MSTSCLKSSKSFLPEDVFWHFEEQSNIEIFKDINIGAFGMVLLLTHPNPAAILVLPLINAYIPLA